MAADFTDFGGNVVRPAHRRCRLVDPDLSRAKSATPVYAGKRSGLAVLAGAGEGFASSGALVGRVYGQHGRVAWTTNETSQRWNFDRDKVNRVHRCQRARLWQGNPGRAPGAETGASHLNKDLAFLDSFARIETHLGSQADYEVFFAGSDGPKWTQIGPNFFVGGDNRG